MVRIDCSKVMVIAQLHHRWKGRATSTPARPDCTTQTHLPSGRYRLMVKGIFFSSSSRSAICKRNQERCQQLGWQGWPALMAAMHQTAIFTQGRATALACSNTHIKRV